MDQKIIALYSAAISEAAKKAIEYIETLDDRSVFPEAIHLEQAKELGGKMPKFGTPPVEVISTLHKLGSPATVANMSGRYFGMVVGGSTPASVGASVLSSAWDQVAVSSMSSPIACQLESIASSWLLDLLSLPSQSSVGFTTGTTQANLICLAAAREHQYAAMGIDVSNCGIAGAQPLKIVLSEQAHITLKKSLRILGFGEQQVLTVPADEQGRINSSALPELDKSTILCLQAGNVNTGAFDNFEAITEIARPAGTWVHVDGAFGLWARASNKLKYLAKGASKANSWAVDCHKWLNTPYDCGLAICDTPTSVERVMHTQESYIPSTNAPQPKDFLLEFSRRARGVEVWATLSELGSEGVSELIERCCNHAKRTAIALRKLGFTVLNSVEINQVLARIGNDRDTARLVERVQQSGAFWFGTTQWHGHLAFRISFSSWATSDSDVDRLIACIESAI
jgi:glutamate/tyrosine decarboxylase-like PLP-dependent enzyme